MNLSTSLKHIGGPIVFINIHASRCDALCLLPNGNIILIPLRDLSETRIIELRRLWIKHLESSRVRARGLGLVRGPEGMLELLKLYLGHMWTWIVHPILEALDLLSPAVSTQTSIRQLDSLNITPIAWRTPLATCDMVSYRIAHAVTSPRGGDLRIVV